MIWFQFTGALAWWGVFIWGGISIARQRDEPIWDRTWSIAVWLFWPVVMPVMYAAWLQERRNRKRMKWNG